MHASYRGHDVYSNPATSRGGIELAMQLNLVEGFDLAALGANSPEALHLLIEAIKVAKTDVYKYVGRSEVHAGADGGPAVEELRGRRAAS